MAGFGWKKPDSAFPTDTAVAEPEKKTKKTGHKGRQPNREPGKVFTAKKAKDNGDGTAVFVIPYNDDQGKRCFREETRKVGKRGGKGRKADSDPLKVLTPKFERAPNGKDLVLLQPYNDRDGNRKVGKITIRVVETGGLSNGVSALVVEVS